MRPPICSLCGRDATEGPAFLRGGWVAFRDYSPLPPGMVGHPHALICFCWWHYPLARALAGLDEKSAFRILRMCFPFAHPY